MRGRAALRWGGAIVLALLLGEALARHYISGPLDIVHRSSDPDLLFELTPGHYLSDGYFTRTDPIEYTVDEGGCRVGPDTPERAGPPLLFLGSSIVFGIGVASGSALPEAARAELQAQVPPVDFTPRNCAVPGYSLEQTLHHAEIALERFGARRIVLVVGPKHGTVPYDWTRIVPQSAFLRWLTGHSRLARLGYLLDIIQETDGFRLPPDPPERLRAALDRFAEATRTTGARVVIFSIGTLEHPSFDLPAELENRKLPMVPIRPPPRDSRYVVSDGDHWSPEGVRFLVHQMAPAIAKMVESSTGDHDGGSTR